MSVRGQPLNWLPELPGSHPGPVLPGFLCSLEVPGSPGKSNKEGQEDQGNLKELGGNLTSSGPLILMAFLLALPWALPWAPWTSLRLATLSSLSLGPLRA